MQRKKDFWATVLASILILQIAIFGIPINTSQAESQELDDPSLYGTSIEGTDFVLAESKPVILKNEIIVFFKKDQGPNNLPSSKLKAIKSSERLFPNALSPDEAKKNTLENFPKRVKHMPVDTEIPDLRQYYILNVAPDADPEVTLEQILSDPSVLHAGFNFIPAPLDALPAPPGAPNDPMFYTTTFPTVGIDQWAPRIVGLGQTGVGSSGWDITTGTPETVIAVLDSGIDVDHPDLKDRLWVNEDEIPNNGIDDDNNMYVDDRNGWPPNIDDDPLFVGGHGTRVSGVAAAAGNNAVGITGIGWNFRIMTFAPFSHIGIQYAVDNGADVINISYVFRCDTYWQSLVDYAWAQGVMIVVAAGNSNQNTSADYPGCNGGENMERIIVVSATDKSDAKAFFSDWGTRIDIAAPGQTIFTTVPLELGVQGGTAANHFALAGSMTGPQMSFYDGESREVRYGSQTPEGVWSFETVQNVGSFFLQDTDIELDAIGTQHLAYFDSDNDALMYAVRSASGWAAEVVDTGEAGWYLDLALDADDKPHIAYYHKNSETVRYAMKTESGWIIQTVDTASPISTPSTNIKLVIDDTGTPHLGYNIWTGQWNARYATLTSGLWNVETVASGLPLSNIAMVVKPEGDKVWIAYPSSGQLVLKTRTGGTWSGETVDTGLLMGYKSLSMVLDEAGQLHLVYQWRESSLTFVLTHAIKTMGGFQKEIVERFSQSSFRPDNFYALGSDLEIDPTSGQLLLLYGVNTGGDLRLAWLADGTWNIGIIGRSILPYGFISGTSLSAPMVAGGLGLFMESHPDWTPEQIRWALAVSADDLGPFGFDPYHSWGRLNLFNMLSLTEPLSDDVSPVASIVSIEPDRGGPLPVIFQGEPIIIKGTAADDNLRQWTMRIKDYGLPYRLVYYERTPVTDGVLWNGLAPSMPEGLQTLKLEVADWYQSEIATQDVLVCRSGDRVIHDLTAFAVELVSLQWRAEVVPDCIQGYHVFRSEYNAVGELVDYRQLTIDPVAEASYIDNTVTCDVQYKYDVRTLLWNGELGSPSSLLVTPRCPIDVQIDIKPGIGPNSVSLSNQGQLPVAILGDNTFDVTEIDPETILLGNVNLSTHGEKSPKLAFSFEDVNADGKLDMISMFSVQELVNVGALTSTTTSLSLTANLFNGIPILGTDSINVVP